MHSNQVAVKNVPCYCVWVVAWIAIGLAFNAASDKALCIS